MDYVKTARAKASRSPCQYKVCAIGFNRRGEYLGMTTNRIRFSKRGGSEHAEMRLIRRYGSRLRTILLVRSSKSGKILNIDPCTVCDKVMKSMGITCKTIY